MQTQIILAQCELNLRIQFGRRVCIDFGCEWKGAYCVGEDSNDKSEDNANVSSMVDKWLLLMVVGIITIALMLSSR